MSRAAYSPLPSTPRGDRSGLHHRSGYYALCRAGTALLKVFAAPNFFDRNISSGNYNYVFNATTNDPKYTHSLKVDYILNSNNTISGTWNAFNEHHTGSVGIPSAGRLNWPQMIKTWGTVPRGYSARYNHICSPTLLNEFSFGFSISRPMTRTPRTS